jgi:hypothetical protein
MSELLEVPLDDTAQCPQCLRLCLTAKLNPLCPLCDGRIKVPELSEVLAAVEEFGRRFLVLAGDAEWTALALWVAHTHAIEGAHATPYLLLTSPEKRSGKTRTQEVLELLVAKPWRAAGTSEAAMFRRIAADRPTLLLDEIDAVFGTYSERTQPLRAILNAGNRPGGSVARCIGDKGDEVRDFPVYCAKCLAGIDTDRLPDTIRDRSISVGMRRRIRTEPVERLRWRDADGDAAPLRARLAAWGEAAVEGLAASDPATPPQLDDRAAEAWEPLLAIADLAGGEWPERARKAAVALSTSDPELSVGSQLLTATRALFNGRERMATLDLLGLLNADEELPFGGWRDGRGLDSRGLARLLHPYGVRPKTIRLDGDATAKGYQRDQFADAWERWAPPPPTEASQASHPSHVTTRGPQKPLKQADVTDVTDVTAISGGAG